jgi:hypothetical protein
MAFKLENLWFAAIIMIVCVTVVTSFYGFMLSNYNVVGDQTKLGKITDSLKGIYDPSLDIKSKIQGQDITGTDAVNQMVQGGYTAARNNPFAVATIGLNATQTIIKESDLGVNPIFYWAFGIILATAIGWAVIYLIMRYRVY